MVGARADLVREMARSFRRKGGLVFAVNGASARARGVYGKFGGGGGGGAEAPFTAKTSPLFGENALNVGSRRP